MKLTFSKLGVFIPLVTLTLPSQAKISGITGTQMTTKVRPNIIFILTDDHRSDVMGYAGNTIIQTPEMDKLAREGVFFKNAFSSTPICAASRASILSGLQERTHKYTFQTGPILEEYMQISYPKVLKQSGYYTGFYGKFGVKYDHQDQLFDVHEDYDRETKYKDRRGYFYKTLGKDTVHLTRYTGEKAIQFIKNAPPDKPFCLSLSFSAPHAHDPAPDQYFWDQGTDKLYQNTEIPKADLSEDMYFNRLPETVKKGFNRTRWLWRFDTPEKYQKSMKGYYRMISGVDLEIAKIRQELKDKGLEKNTVIILSGDNGYFLGERQLADKWLLYDLSIRIPLIVYDPRFKKHQDIDAMALNLDIPATIADLAGVSQPISWHGKSLVPVISGKSNNLQRDTILIEHLWEFDSIPPSEGIRTNHWKYFRYVNDKSTEELYNLKDDSKEINNLSKNVDYQNILKSLRNKCNELTKKYADPYSGVPSGLMVEYIRDPQKTVINDSLPEYSWIVPIEAKFQKAYQILVSSNNDLLDKNIGDVWNSRQVRSNKSINIEHGGNPLKPNIRYFWKLRLWDQDNRISDYSSTQTFKTGNFKGTVSSQNSFQVEILAPVSFRKIALNSYFIDFGKDAFGTLEIKYQSTKPDTLIVRLGEKLLNGKIDRKPGGSIRFAEIKLPVTSLKSDYLLSLPKDKRNTSGDAVLLPDSFGVVMPFRYCELENVKQPLKDDDVRQKAWFHYFDYNQSQFTSSDTILNQVWDLCKYSIKATSFTGLYIDGDRERIPYEADAYINQLGHYTTDREYAMTKQTIEYFMTHPTWPTEWQLHTSMMMIQDYYYTGDTELLKKYYEQLKYKTLDILTREDGLISLQKEKIDGRFMANLGFADTTKRLRDIVDWPAGSITSGNQTFAQKGERDGHQMLPINTVVNCFFYQNMKIMAEIAALLKKPQDRNYYESMAMKVKKTINEILFDREKGIYIDGEDATNSSLHSNMLPLAFGIVPKESIHRVAEFVKSRGMACSVYGSQYLLEGLYEAGESQFAMNLMRATNDRSWWNMIKIGSTIALEAWDPKYKPNLDWNHAWGAVPANIIPRYVWGIQPAAPGFELIQIKPKLGNLKTSSITIPTIKGPVKGDFRRVNDSLQQYVIEIPANVGGEFILDDLKEIVVTLNGTKVNQAFNSIRLEPGISKIEISVNSY